MAICSVSLVYNIYILTSNAIHRAQDLWYFMRLYETVFIQFMGLYETTKYHNLA